MNQSVSRKDQKHGYWTLFNQRTGTKIRLSLKPGAKAPEKAYSPEIMDVKITDKCDVGCKFCYMDSTRNGQHASISDLIALADALASMKVFEVAIGGGEPTDHPDFVQFLQELKSKDIVPNFTTAKLGWLSDKNCLAILENCGAFAYSVTCTKQVQELINSIESSKKARRFSFGGEWSKVTIQIVMGTMGRPEFESVLSMAKDHGIPVTLLGFKSVGRGAKYKPKTYDWWLDSCKNLVANYELPLIRVDTALAAQYENEIKASGIPEWCFHVLEGKFSAYYDAVAKKFARSSYQLDGAVSILSKFGLHDELLKAFQKF